MDIEKTAWHGSIKEITEKLANNTSNLQNIHTPFEIVNGIIDKLKEYTGFEGKTFCVFNLEFVEALIYDYGVAKEKITFITDCKEKAKIAGHERYKGVNVVEGNFLTTEINMKFDLIIGNPPYQKPKERKTDAVKGMCGSTLWDKFIIKSVNICKDGGYMGLITPGQWRKPAHKLFSLFQENDLMYLEIHNMNDGFKTFGVQTGFDWYILRKTNYSGGTVIKDSDGNIYKIDFSKCNFLPNSCYDIIEKIVAKDGEEKCPVIFSYSSYETRKMWMSPVQTDEFNNPCVYSLTKTNGLKLFYSSTKDNGHFGIKKVIIPCSKYTDMFFDNEGKYGICQFAFGIQVDSDQEAKGIEKALRSEKFNLIWNATEWVYNNKNWQIFKYFRKDFWKEFIDEKPIETPTEKTENKIELPA